MLTKAEFLASLQREHDITLHLVSKLTPVLAEFRLSPGQRSTLELLRYLTVQIEGTLGFFLTASWDGWETAEEAAKLVISAGLIYPEDLPAPGAAPDLP